MTIRILRYLIYFLVITNFLNAQSRIRYNNRDLFLNGSNFAWINFAKDIGPGKTNFTRFEQIFKEVKSYGGNAMRLWLHTDGSATPEFNSNGIVIGPGSGAINDLQQILDLAWENEVGVMLCLWSHDMLRTSHPTNMKTRNKLLLSDTTAMRAYINKALIPMVEAIQGHPGILAWEIFNEPEGITNEFGWDGWDEVPISNIQRTVNLIAGAIHRADPTALVTNGSAGLAQLVDVPTLAKASPNAFINSLSDAEKKTMEKEYEFKFGQHLSASEIVSKLYNTTANYNFYRDDRLIAAGGDPDGTLDFYTAHYYSWAGTALSPFHNDYSTWNLNKPLAIAEFFMVDAFGVSYSDLYEQLYSTGYAGALSWQWWGDTPEDDYSWNHARTAAAMQGIYENHPDDVVVNPRTGTIFSYKGNPTTIEKGDSSLIEWSTQSGSVVTINGASVASDGSMYVKPVSTTDYVLSAQGEISSIATVRINVIPSGTILEFKAAPPQISLGRKSKLFWNTSAGSQVTLNGVSVNAKDFMEVSPEVTTDYVLATTGDLNQTQTVTVSIVAPELINWALLKPVTVLSSEPGVNENPANVVDGNYFSEWMSGYSNSQWLEIDLEEEFTIKEITIYWGEDYASGYRVGISSNQSNYKLVSTVTSGTGGIESVANLPADGRYVKLMLDKRSGSKGFSIMEIELFGLPKSVSIEDYIFEKKIVYYLSQNYPNPFNPATSIRYSVPEQGFVNLEVYNVIGNRVAILVNEMKNPGEYNVQFDGASLASGIYYYRFKASNFIKTGKMILLK